MRQSPGLIMCNWPFLRTTLPKRIRMPRWLVCTKRTLLATPPTREPTTPIAGMTLRMSTLVSLVPSKPAATTYYTAGARLAARVAGFVRRALGAMLQQGLLGDLGRLAAEIGDPLQRCDQEAAPQVVVTVAGVLGPKSPLQPAQVVVGRFADAAVVAGHAVCDASPFLQLSLRPSPGGSLPGEPLSAGVGRGHGSCAACWRGSVSLSSSASGSGFTSPAAKHAQPTQRRTCVT